MPVPKEKSKELLENWESYAGLEGVEIAKNKHSDIILLDIASLLRGKGAVICIKANF